jgi:formate hydrogenlyase transcriptional activator
VLHPKIKELTEDGIRSLCAFPLTCVHQRIGCLLIGSKQPEAYSEDEVRFLSLIADMIASAVAGAMNFEALRKAQADLQGEKDRLQLLLELNNQVISNLELRDSPSRRLGQRSSRDAVRRCGRAFAGSGE